MTAGFPDSCHKSELLIYRLHFRTEIYHI